MKNILLLLSFIFFFFSFTSAQLHVVKDNIACAYGLKNDNGQWVVKPGYTSMEYQHNGFFIAETGGKMGLFSPEGKVVIPFLYRYLLNDRRGDLYIVSDSIFSNVYTLQGKKLFPDKYDEIHREDKYFFLYINRNDSVFSSCSDLSGHILFENVYGVISADPESDYLFLSRENSESYHGSLKGVLDIRGKIVLPCVYDEIRSCEGSFRVKVGDKDAFVNTKNEFLLAPLYTVEEENFREITCLRPDEFRLIESENKMGAINAKYEVIIHPEYNSIRMIPIKRGDVKSHVFLVQKDEKYGLISKEGVELAPTDYSGLWPVKRLYNHHPSTNVFISTREGKYGVMDEKGNQVVENIYDNYYAPENYSYEGISFFNKGIQFYGMDLKKDSIYAEEAKLILVSDSLRFFEYKGDYFIFCTSSKMPKQMKICSYSDDGFKNFKTDKRLVVTLGRRVAIFNLKGKRLDRNNIKYIKHGVMHCEGKKMGLLNMRTGEVLVDTIYQNVYPNLQRNKIWVQLSGSSNAGWIVFDTLGKRRSDFVFDYRNYSDEGIVGMKGLFGYISSDFTWIIPPKYRNIQSFGDQFFGVETVEGKIGVLDSAGNEIIEADYTEFLPVFMNGYFYHPDSIAIAHRKDIPVMWMLRNNEKRVLLNNYKEKITAYRNDSLANRKMDSLLLELGFSSRSYGESSKTFENVSIYSRLNKMNGAFSIEIGFLDLDSIANKRLIYDIFRKHYEDNLACATAGHSFHTGNVMRYCTYPQQQVNYEIANAGNDFASLFYYGTYKIYRNDTVISTEYIQQYENYILQNKAFKKLKILDVFGTTEILQEELIAAIQAKESLELDCSTPENLVKQVGENFLLTPQGVMLVLPIRNGSTSVLVSKERLQSRKETAWIVAYLE